MEHINSHSWRTVLTLKNEELAVCLIVMVGCGWGFSKGEVKDCTQDFINFGLST